MQPETKRSVEELRESLRARKANAEGALQRFKIVEIMRDPPAVDLTHNSLPNIPASMKPRIR
jgi:hypothetical protein